MVAREHDVGRVDADLGGHLHRRAAGREAHRRLLHAAEQPGVAVRALAVVTRLGGAVQNGDPGCARCVRKARAVADEIDRGRGLRQRGQHRGAPTTPFCTSCNTSAVCAGATSAERSSGIEGDPKAG